VAELAAQLPGRRTRIGAGHGGCGRALLGIIRRLRHPCDGIARHCAAGNTPNGTMMSHYFGCQPLTAVALAILMLTGGVMARPAPAPLVAGRRPPQLLGAATLLAAPPAVRLATIARATDTDAAPAAPTLKEPNIRLHLHLPAALDSAGGGRHKWPAASPTGAPHRWGPGVDWCRARALALSANQHTETNRPGRRQPDRQLYRSREHRPPAPSPPRRQRDRRMRSSTAGTAGLQ
jgi:hypothetical protein